MASLLRFVACVVFSLLTVTRAIPAQDLTLSVSNETRLTDLTVPGPPHFVIYADRYERGITGPPPVSQIRGYNVFALSFLLLEGAWDKAYEWTTLSRSQRSDIKHEYHSAGVKLIVSVFGSTDIPTSSGADPIATADRVAAWVKEYDLDGVDVDYEDYSAMMYRPADAVAWLISFTRQVRVHLPQGQYILSHAPVAPWFAKNNKYGWGAYRTVHWEVGKLIDWYNVQFYNQGPDAYTTCNSLLWHSGGEWPGSSLFEIAYSGIPWEKLVIGKPADAGAASNGYMSSYQLTSCVQEARQIGWNGGVMVWQYPDASSNWIQSIRAAAFPM